MNRTRQRTLVLAILLGTLLAAWWWPSAEKRASADAGSLVDAATATPPSTPGAKAPGANSAARNRHEPARRQSEPTPLDAPALGFRASPDQRADDLAKLNSASDLAPLLAEFQRRAAQGDADAAARMRDIYEECYGTHAFLPRATDSLVTPDWGYASMQMVPGSDPVRAAAIAHARGRCAGILPGNDSQARTLALLNAERISNRLAADLGHLVARIRAAQTTWEPDPVLRTQRDLPFTRALLREGTPEALMALFHLGLEGTGYSPEAWALVACEQGYPCTNVPFTRVFGCGQFGTGCATQGWVDWLHDQLPARTWRRTQAQRDEILTLWRAGNVDALLQPPPAAGGG